MSTFAKAVTVRTKIEKRIGVITKQLDIWNRKLSDAQKDLANINRQLAKELGLGLDIAVKPAKAQGKRPCAVCAKKGAEIFSHDARWHRWNPKVPHRDLEKALGKK